MPMFKRNLLCLLHVAADVGRHGCALFLRDAPGRKKKKYCHDDLSAVPPQHCQQPTSDHRSGIAPLSIHPNDIRRRAISSGGSAAATAPISPQISIYTKYSKNEGNLRGKWMCSAAAADPPELIAASGIQPNGIGEWPMRLQ
eukprot:scaffold248407_cov75-Cyclotella_meneghiniana.AAC.6